MRHAVLLKAAAQKNGQPITQVAVDLVNMINFHRCYIQELTSQGHHLRLVYACSTFGQGLLEYEEEDEGIWSFLLTSSIRSSLSDLTKPGPLPYQQLHFGACLAQAAFLVVELPIRKEKKRKEKKIK